MLNPKYRSRSSPHFVRGPRPCRMRASSPGRSVYCWSGALLTWCVYRRLPRQGPLKRCQHEHTAVFAAAALERSADGRRQPDVVGQLELSAARQRERRRCLAIGRRLSSNFTLEHERPDRFAKHEPQAKAAGILLEKGPLLVLVRHHLLVAIATLSNDLSESRQFVTEGCPDGCASVR